jgi:coproporphyrinogen III oxidase-like Fe-S oxidoreductase
VTRHARAKQPEAYMKADAGVEEHVVSPAELPFEFMLNALRLVEGFDLDLFGERTGLPISAVAARLCALEARGLVTRDWKRVRPSERGRRFLNELLGEFLPDK